MGLREAMMMRVGEACGEVGCELRADEGFALKPAVRSRAKRAPMMTMRWRGW
jgi:hypothetical protein